MNVVLGGLALGLSFNPLAAPAGSALAAALSGYSGARRDRIPLSVAAVLGAWLLGDGLRVMARLRDGMDAGAPEYAALALWGAAGLALGYALPAVLGAYVGRRVHFGTGWLAAGSVAASSSFALAALGAALLDLL